MPIARKPLTRLEVAIGMEHLRRRLLPDTGKACRDYRMLIV